MGSMCKACFTSDKTSTLSSSIFCVNNMNLNVPDNLNNFLEIEKRELKNNFSSVKDVMSFHRKKLEHFLYMNQDENMKKSLIQFLKKFSTLFKLKLKLIKERLKK